MASIRSLLFQAGPHEGAQFGQLLLLALESLLELSLEGCQVKRRH
jgi:hypothetical protein